MGYSAEVLDDRHATILVCEDEEWIRQILRAELTARAYYYCEATTGNEVLRAVPVLRPDAILLDLGLPDMDGIEVMKRIRLSTRTPIMVLSVRAGTSEKIAAFDAGADDYLSKPWQAPDLDERIRSMLFRTSFHGAVFQARDLVVDLNRRTVQIGKKEIQITATEYDLLKILVLNAGRLLTQGRLTHELWGEM